MNRRFALITACLAIAGALPAAASAAAPGWSLAMTPLPANFAPGQESEYAVIATNVGAAPTVGNQIEVKTTVPETWTISSFNSFINDRSVSTQPTCSVAGHTLVCKGAQTIRPGYLIRVKVGVTVPPGAPEETLESESIVSGGGAAQDVSAVSPTPVQADPVSFDFLSGFNAPATDDEASVQVLAGSHPYQQTVSFSFPTKNPGDGLTNDGHPRNIYVELPRGMVGSPAATKVLCTEAELTTEGCPDEAQVGLTDVTTLGGDVGISDIFTSNLYNMVPPPGVAAEFATDVANIGVFVHVLAGVRSEGDYGVEAVTHDVIAFGQQPIFGVQAQIWGSPTAKAHDAIRGECGEVANETCPVTERDIAFLTMPGECQGVPSLFEVLADSWEEPGPEFELHRTRYESADLAGNTALLAECSALEFEPTIEARPQTVVTDSPTGLDFTLSQPQKTDFNESSPAALKDAVVSFPAGLTINASQASGLGACTQTQVGFKGEEEGGLRFTDDPQGCPDAAKLGTIEVTSPVLVARNEANEVEETPEGDPILEPVHGAIYVAKPFANPFGSLIAVYLVVEDPRTGIVAKLAGKGDLDRQTGQITTSFVENPELPLEDIAVHLFGGSRAAFVTPPVCGEFTTEAALTPWSAPEGEDAHPKDSFRTAAAPSGGPCPTTEAQLPNTPKFFASMESPAAGKYSPLLFKLSREDGTQRLSKIEATLPTGLSAKLAGVSTCSEANIAKARSREAPEKGALEQSDPSCPAASGIGTVVASAGAGPNPYNTQGQAYLAGPYKGAPLSVVAIAAAIAGPFDLGTVVVRSALYLDPTTAQARVVSDPLPTILQGVPIDLRSVAVRADRPSFSLNPTSCNEKSFGGQVLSILGSPSALFQRFQVGGCKSLPYKPKMSVRLFGPTHRGGHPRLRAVFTAKPGEANTAAISFAFPKSEFIDQAHFRTICTRVQFAANQCPTGSVYGHVVAHSPLLGYPLKGPAYLRSSSHKLPDLVIALHGPASQPIEVDAVGRVDSINGGLRVRFESVPDAPLSKVIVTAQGAKKGLFQNSTNICKGSHRATLKLDAQNGKVQDSQPKLVAQCGSKGKGAKKKLHLK